MKKKWLMTVLMAALMLAMAFAFTACGGSDEQTEESGDAEQTEDADHSNHAESNDAGGEEERQIVGKERQ